MNNQLLIPGSILAGCLTIALGVYSRPAQETPRAPAPRPTATAATSETQAAVERQARQALFAARQSSFIPKCWTPVVSASPGPATSTYYFQLTFDAQGKELGRSINERRGLSRPDVANCLRKLPIGLEVPAPGTPVRVDIPLDFG